MSALALPLKIETCNKNQIPLNLGQSWECHWPYWIAAITRNHNKMAAMSLLFKIEVYRSHKSSYHGHDIKDRNLERKTKHQAKLDLNYTKLDFEISTKFPHLKFLKNWSVNYISCFTPPVLLNWGGVRHNAVCLSPSWHTSILPDLLSFRIAYWLFEKSTKIETTMLTIKTGSDSSRRYETYFDISLYVCKKMKDN